MDMSTLKKQTPGQKIHRLELILETIRENQNDVSALLAFAFDLEGFVDMAREILSEMHKQDRDVLLWGGGIFTEKQLILLMDDVAVEAQEWIK